MYAFAVGFVTTAFQAYLNTPKRWALAWGIWCGFLAIYASWIFFFYFLNRGLIISPFGIWSAAADIAEHGYSLRGATGRGSNTVGTGAFESAKGSANYFFWSVEAVIVMAAAIVGGLMNARDEKAGERR